MKLLLSKKNLVFSSLLCGSSLLSLTLQRELVEGNKLRYPNRKSFRDGADEFNGEQMRELATCENREGYGFENDDNKNCDTWVKEKSSRCEKKDKENQNEKVKFFCPAVCDDKCRGECENKEGYHFKNKKGKGCISWVANDPKARCKKKDNKNDKKKVSFFCPAVCNDDCVTPTSKPTSEPTPSFQESKGCCSTDYKTCNGLCSSSREFCETNPICTIFNSVWLDKGADKGTCFSLYFYCTYNVGN